MAALLALLAAAGGCSVAGGGPAPKLRVHASGAAMFEPRTVAGPTTGGPAPPTLRVHVSGAALSFEPPVVVASSNYTKMWFPNVAVNPRPGVMVVQASTGCDGPAGGECNGSREGAAPDLYITQDSGNSWTAVVPSQGQVEGSMGNDATGDTGALPLPPGSLPPGEYVVINEACDHALRPCVSPNLTSEKWSWVRNMQHGERVVNLERKNISVVGMPRLAGRVPGEGPQAAGINGIWSKAIRLSSGDLLLSFERNTLGLCFQHLLLHCSHGSSAALLDGQPLV